MSKRNESTEAKSFVAPEENWERQLDSLDSALMELRDQNQALSQRTDSLRQRSGDPAALKKMVAEISVLIIGLSVDRRLLNDLKEEIDEAQAQRARVNDPAGVELVAAPGLSARLQQICSDVEKLRLRTQGHEQKIVQIETVLKSGRPTAAVVKAPLAGAAVVLVDAECERESQVAETKKHEQLVKGPAVIPAASPEAAESGKMEMDSVVKRREANLAMGFEAQALNNVKIHYNQEIERLREAYRNEVNVIKAERANLVTELGEAKAKAEELKKEVLNSQSEIEKSKLQSERVALSVRAEQAQAISQRDLKIQEIEALRLSGEREIKRLQGIESRLKAEYTRAEDRFRKIETELRAEASKYQSEYLRLSTKLASASEQLGVLRAEKSALQKEAVKAAELAQALNAEKLRVQELESSLAVRTREIDRLQEIEKSLRTELEHLTDRSRAVEFELKSETNKYQSELARACAQLATATEQVAKLRAERDAFERELKEAGDRGKSLSEKEFKLQERESQLRSRDQEIDRLVGVEVKLRAEIERLATRFDETERSMRAELLELGTENSRLQMQIASSHEQLSSVRAEKAQLEANLKKAVETAATAGLFEVKCKEFETKQTFLAKEVQHLTELEVKLREQLAATEVKLGAIDEQARQEILKHQTECSKLSVQLAASSEQIAFLKTEKAELEKNVERLSSLNEMLTEKIAKLQESEIEFEAGTREVSRLIESEQRLKGEYTQAVEQFRDLELALREKIAQLQSEVARTEVALATSNEKLASLRAEKADLEGEAEKSFGLREDLAVRQRRVRDLEANLEAHQQEIERLNENEQRLQADLSRSSEHFRDTEERLRSEAARYQSELVTMSNNLGEISEQVTTLRLERDDLESQLVRAREQVQTLAGKAVKLKEVESQYEALEQQVRRMSSNEQKLRGEIETAEQRFRSLEIQLRPELSKYQVENGSLAAQLAGARDSISLLKSDKAALEVELGKAAETVTKLREEAYQAQQVAHFEREESARQARETETKLNTEISAAQMRLNHAESRVRESQAQIYSLELQLTENQKVSDKEIVNLKKIIAEFEGQEKEIKNREAEAEEKLALAEARLADTEDVSADLAMCENQLRIYSGGLTREKAELQKIGKIFVSEIRLLSSTHPLKDYLAATEFEISKVEAHLSTMPTIMAERVKVEDGLKKLLQQRDFLRTVLADSQKQFEGQAQKIEKILASGGLAPVPPPPAVRRPAKSAERRDENHGQVPSSVVEGLRWEKPAGDLA